jgi:hypothetical protein
MHDEFLNQRHGTFFFIAILDGIFFALTVVLPNLDSQLKANSATMLQ